MNRPASWLERTIPVDGPVDAPAIEPMGIANEPSDTATTAPTNIFPRFRSIGIFPPMLELPGIRLSGELRYQWREQERDRQKCSAKMGGSVKTTENFLHGRGSHYLGLPHPEKVAGALATAGARLPGLRA